MLVWKWVFEAAVMMVDPMAAVWEYFLDDLSVGM